MGIENKDIDDMLQYLDTPLTSLKVIGLIKSARCWRSCSSGARLPNGSLLW
jgi:hypothetical protein